MSVGAIAVSQNNPDLVYIGTGESNNRQSTSWGDGVYKSTDGGKTYTNIGLKTSRHINRIVIDPRNNDVVWVAATGPLFGPGGERGVFKTADGGKTWKQTLKVDDDTGANELVDRRHRQQDSLRVHLPAAADVVLHERRRARQRHVEVHRRRRDLDAPEERPARRAARPHRVRRVPQAAEHHLRPRRGPRRRSRRRRRRAGGAAPGARAPERRRRGRRARRGSGAAGGGTGPRSGRRRWPRPRDRRECISDGPLSLRRRGRDVAEGQQQQSAADVLQPGAHRSQRSRSRLHGRRRPADDHRRRQDRQYAGGLGDPLRSPRDLDRPGQFRITW